MNRREFALGGLGALTASLSGCGQLESVSSDEDTTATTEGTQDTPQQDRAGSDENTTPMIEEWNSFRGDAGRTGRIVAEEGPGESLSVAWQLNSEAAVRAAAEDIPSDTMLSIEGTSWPIVADEYLIWMVQHHGFTDTASYGTQLLAVDTSGSIEWSRELSYMGGDPRTRTYGPQIDNGLLYHPKPSRLQLGSDVETDSSPKTMVITVRDPETGDVERELDLGISAWGRTLVDDGRIFVLTTSEELPRLAAFDAESGAEQWSVEAPVSYYNDVPFGSLSEDALFHFELKDGYSELVARDVEDGSVRWRTPLDIVAPYWNYESTPFELPTVGNHVPFYLPTVGDHVYTAGNNAAQRYQMLAPLVGLNTDDGTEANRYRPPGIESETNPARNRSQALHESEEAQRASEELPPASGLYGMPLPMDDLVVATGYGAVEGTDDESRCFAIEDGSIAWSVESEWGVLVAAGDVIYLASKEGLKAISKEGDILDSITFADHDELGSSNALYYGDMMPAIGNGLLYLPNDLGITAIE